MMIKRVFCMGCLLVTVSVFAAQHEAVAPLHPADYIVLNTDVKPIAANYFEKIDLKKTAVQLISKNKQNKAQQNFKTTMDLLAKTVRNYPIIAGIKVESSVPLDHAMANDIALLANKSAVFANDFTFKEPEDWAMVFNAEARNLDLLTTIYSAAAAKQIQSNLTLGTAFIQSAPLIQLTQSDTEQPKQQALFWQAVAKNTKGLEQNAVIILLDHAATNDTYRQLVPNILTTAATHLIWIGGANPHQFVAAKKELDIYNVWRIVDGKVKNYSFSQKNSPQQFYLALGMNPVAYDVLSNIIIRLQGLENENVVFAPDAVDDHAIWFNMSATTLLDENELYTVPTKGVPGTTQSNILLFNPSVPVLNKWWTNINYSLNDISHMHQLGIFDYSSTKNNPFYQTIVPVVHYTKGIQVAYNAMNEENVNSFLSQDYTVDRIDLGKKASRLLLKTNEKQSTCVELKTTLDQNPLKSDSHSSFH